MRLHNIIAVVLMVSAAAGCGRRAASADEHAHDEKLQLAAYGDRFELFAEADPLVAGQSGGILAHFSYLSDFKPLGGDSVTVSLIVGTDGIRQTAAAPSRPGIYEFTLTPPAVGTGKLVFDIDTPEGTSQVVVTGVKIYGDEHDAQHAAAKEAVSSTSGVVFTKEQSWKVDFATAEVVRRPFGQVIHTAARIAPSQADETVITAKAAGVVSFTSGDVVPGKSVSAGQALFSIESGGMADNNLSVRYNEAATEYNRAKTEYERKQSLAEDLIVSQSDLLQAETEFRTAEANYNNLRRNFANGRQTVSSPMAGFVKQVLVGNGNFVEAGQALAVVSRNTDLLITANVQSKYGPMLADITGANFRVMTTGRVWSLDELGGKVLSYGRSTDTDNPLIPVSFSVRNTAGLMPGTFVDMYITTRTTSGALTVPNGALVEEMGAFFVFVQLTPEYFEKRAVTTGVGDGFSTEITGGVAEGERVVSRGAILVKLAQSSGALDAHSGHVH